MLVLGLLTHCLCVNAAPVQLQYFFCSYLCLYNYLTDYEPKTEWSQRVAGILVTIGFR